MVILCTAAFIATLVSIMVVLNWVGSLEGNKYDEIQNTIDVYYEEVIKELGDDVYSVKSEYLLGHDDENEDPVNRERRNAVKEAFEHSYGGYEQKCLGKGELKPVTGKCHEWLVHGLGLSIMDSLDTMLLMNFTNFYKNARVYLHKNLNWNKPINVQVFEVTIRCLGGLLSAYEMTKDPFLLNKAQELAEKLLPAFETPTGFPSPNIHLTTKKKTFPKWTTGKSILSEIGTIQMEFALLSHLTKNPIYNEKAMKIFTKLKSTQPKDKIYQVFIDTNTGKFSGMRSVGALGDSFYEYILKIWLLTNKSDPEMGEWFYETADAIIEQLTFKFEPDMYYIASKQQSGKLIHTMEHLTCFAGGMFGLASLHTTNNERKEKYMEVAKGIAKFCYEMYKFNPLGLPSESIQIDKGILKKPKEVAARKWLMRPEAVETWFIMWRITKDDIYRDWGWEFLESMNKFAKSKYGYSGIRDPSISTEVKHDDVQQSYFLAETLKYLYLLFSPDDVIPLDKFYFNTEAHAFSPFTP